MPRVQVQRQVIELLNMMREKLQLTTPPLIFEEEASSLGRLAWHLDEPWECDFQSLQLRQVLDDINRVFAVNVEVDYLELDATGVDPDTLITYEQTGGSLEYNLTKILEPLDLVAVYTLNTITITGEDALTSDGAIVQKVYRINDILESQLASGFAEAAPTIPKYPVVPIPTIPNTDTGGMF